MRVTILPLVVIAALVGGCPGDGQLPVTETPAPTPGEESEETLYLSANLVQMVTEEVACPGSWPEYQKYWAAQDQWYVPSLQEEWVNTFATRAEWSEVTAQVIPEVVQAGMGVSLSINWACWDSDSSYDDWVMQQLAAFEEAGLAYRLILYQYGSTPMVLETGEPATSGWMNPDVAMEFGRYTSQVLGRLSTEGLNPDEIALIRELNGMISLGCTSPDMQAPPGVGVDWEDLSANTQCLDIGLENGLRALHAGLQSAASFDFNVGADHNVRPEADDDTLDYLYNGCWFSGLSGKWDFDCDGNIDVEDGPSADYIGVTFYGGWTDEGIPVRWENRGLVTIQYPDTTINPELFATALEQASAYGLPVVVGEIGFSEKDEFAAGEDMRSYLEVIRERGGITSISLHAGHRHAELTQGEFFFELYELASRTDWGQEAFAIWEEWRTTL